jgi:hypothetical protein
MAGNAQAGNRVLEKAFWQSMVDGSAEVATAMLTEPALMVSGHGLNKFDHAAYEKMAGERLLSADGTSSSATSTCCSRPRTWP